MTKTEMIGTQTGFIKSKILPGRSTLQKIYLDGTEEIQYHNTNVVTKKPDGSIIFNSGGFKTMTTKERMCKYSSHRIIQNNHIWYVLISPDKMHYPFDLSTLPVFYDGMIIKDGKVISGLKSVDLKKHDKIKKQIKKYVSLITKDNLPMPSSGDCFFCQMHEVKTDQPLGDVIKDNDHLLLHLKEGYLMGSVMVNAMRESGYQDQQIGFHYQIKLVDTFRRSVTK